MVAGIAVVTCLQFFGLLESPVSARDLSVLSLSHGESYQAKSVLKPLEIDASIDRYIEEHLPEPTDALSTIYDKSLPIPNSDLWSVQGRFVVLTFANAEYFENLLINNWMCSLRALDIDNFVVVPIDEAASLAAQRVDDSILPPDSIYWDSSFWMLLGEGSKRDNITSFSGQLRKGFKPTEIFIEFIWRRAQFVRTLLTRYPDLNIVLSDADTTWAHRPWDVVPQYFNQTNACDMFFTNDVEYGETEEPLRTVEPLSGFIMIRNRDVVHELYQKWIKAALVFHNKISQVCEPPYRPSK
ncbi:expressed unknown protein [Seminavis robusta]|uniref:Nucleotide-diphospho-sugar transferase domain-containing protein n=1 Tax=Seminavis robusta TaxID=568900 RepID=A0A9N8D9Z5_9STRA|nr:expressed unknown protein [Seminavis robusta]|eukprot:Sro54_g031720.1 n/a (298) ;mRNA; r:27881-28774